MQIDIGIEDDKRRAVADALAQTLADTYALYQKTHLYHWNVQGPRFAQLHTLFETQYRELWDALDEIAERIRALGEFAPTHSEMAKRAQVANDNDSAPSEDAMINALRLGQEAVVRSARAALELAENAGDQASADLMTERVAHGEKTAWMLRAHLEA